MGQSSYEHPPHPSCMKFSWFASLDSLISTTPMSIPTPVSRVLLELDIFGGLP